jgi:hypothetical protein
MNAFDAYGSIIQMIDFPPHKYMNATIFINNNGSIIDTQ